MNNFNEGFYVWVPSNAPSPSGVANKPQQFTVALQHTDQLQGKWEVALTEIHYPNNWFNVKEDVTFRVFYSVSAEHMQKQAENLSKPSGTKQAAIAASEDDVKAIRAASKNHEAVVVPAGYYSSIHEIIEKINLQSKLMKIVKVFSKDLLQIIQVFDFQDAPQTWITTEQSGLNLLGMLGIIATPAFVLPKVGTKQPSLDMHFPALYIYCNFIDVQYVGNERASIIRVVPISGKAGEYAHKEFNNRYYLTLSTGYINSISFEIRDDTGEPVKFMSGKVTLGLHFRPKRI